MQSELRVPGDVSPIARMIDVKDQQITEIVEHYERRKSPYKKWVQTNTSKEACEADYWLVAHSPAAYRISKFLVANMDRYNAVICSYKVMQEKFNLGQATVARAIKLLKKHKFVDIVKSGTSNVYMINKQLYWNSWGTNYAYAEFGAKIIISASEQDEEVQEEIQLEIKKRQEVIIKEEQKAS